MTSSENVKRHRPTGVQLGHSLAAAQRAAGRQRSTQAGGAEQVTIGQQQMPAHNHLVQATKRIAKNTDPAAHVLAQIAGHAYDGNTDGTTMNPEMITSARGGQPICNIQPYLVLNFCIALQGLYPPQD